MINDLSIFGFTALWSPYFLAFTIILALLYIFIVDGPLRKNFKNAEDVSFKQKLYFLSAVFLIYIVKGSPLDLLGHLNFSIHMTQMALLYLTVPPLLLFGTPKWLLRSILSVKFIHSTVKFFTKPLIAILFFNGSFSFYHFPFIFDTIKSDIFLHAAVTIVIFVAAMFMWWPLVSPLPELGKLSGLQKIGYIFADGVLLTPACAIIIFAEEPLYLTYTNLTYLKEALKLCIPASQLAQIDPSQLQMFTWLSAKNDQQLGGIIMKIIQEIMYGIILGYNFFQWVKEEKGRDKIDPVPMIPVRPQE